MLSEYQKQLNRIYFFSNKVVAVGKIDYKPQFKPIDTLISRLKQQLEQKVTLGIEKELTLEQMENRVKIYLPTILGKIDLEKFTLKDFYNELEQNKILTKGDITAYKNELKDIVKKQIEIFENDKEKREQEKQKQLQIEKFEDLTQELKRKVEKSEKKKREVSTSDTSDDIEAKKQLEETLNQNELDEDIGRVIRSKDFDTIFKKLKYRVDPIVVVDTILTLNDEGKIDASLKNLTLSSSDKISKILEDEKDIKVSKYIIQALMGRHSKAYDLKNILLKN